MGELKDLQRRIIEISYRHKLSHIGSCLTALPIMQEIYELKKPDEKFVLSAGHAHLAHAVLMEAKGIIKDAEKNIEEFGIHCDIEGGCDVSTGSLGQGLPIAVGMALADRTKNVYCLISDGETMEGSIWEALRIQYEQKLFNLKVYLNWNGWAAYRDTKELIIQTFTISMGMKVINTNVDDFPFLIGQDAHYHVMNEEEYKQAMRILK